MGPADYLAMQAGYRLKMRHRAEQSERELYLLRRLVYTVHNATSKPRLQHPAQVMPLEIDKHIKDARRDSVAERKKKAKKLFAMARERGVLDQNNKVIGKEE